MVQLFAEEIKFCTEVNTIFADDLYLSGDEFPHPGNLKGIMCRALRQERRFGLSTFRIVVFTLQRL